MLKTLPGVDGKCLHFVISLEEFILIMLPVSTLCHQYILLVSVKAFQ